MLDNLPDEFDSEDLRSTQLQEPQGGIAASPLRPERTSIGRYQIVRQLGSGGFGLVYLARDEVLQRDVAVKVPRWDLALTPRALGRFLQEGQMLAQVNHPAIVAVHDYGQTNDGIPFVVMQLVEGESLQKVLKGPPLTQLEAVDFQIQIAEALVAAHRQMLVHRDLKPANLIVDGERRVHVVDFGLALHEDLLPGAASGAGTPGTPEYMAPEQIRGENHLIDGRTDIWAFGVTMYRMLTGRLPFSSKDSQELFRAICYRQPRSPQKHAGLIAPELERICLRCLQKLQDDRYPSVRDLLEELRMFRADAERQERRPDFGLSDLPTARSLQGLVPAAGQQNELPSRGSRASANSASAGGTRPSLPGRSPPEPGSVIPKGLRPFDQNDAGFFLGLLPGPVDRLGVPESIRFWTSRLDVEHQVEDVPVGLVYGPSGCGKSSFVRAGLIPRLSGRVIPVYIDCTTDDLPLLVMERLRREIDGLPPGLGLVELLRQIRLGKHLNRGDKLLLVLDQFEQWLSRAEHYAEQELTEALRQCSPDRLQALLLVRDDFWLSASQFFRCLQGRIEESRNAMALPLLDERHARRVLEAYGRVYGSLPGGDQPLSASQERFVREAVSSLARRGRVICVHLSVFAETCRNRPWTPGEWKSVGGWEGIGREYVAGIFNDPGTPAYISRHASDAWKILGCLLPQPGSDLKGQALSRRAIREASGVGPAGHFDQLLDFLISQARLVSPLESMLAEEEAGAGAPAGAQGREVLLGLTHDFLVSPIRAWGMAKQNETREGRAATLLHDLASQWKLTGDRRFLPSLPDYVRISRLTPRPLREAESRFWSAARRKTLWTASLLGAGVLALVLTAVLLFRWQHQNQTRLLVAEYLSCPASYVERHWGPIIDRWGETTQLLEAGLASDDLLSRVRASAALVVRDPGHDKALATWLQSVPDVPGEEFASYRAAASADRERLVPKLHEAWESRSKPDESDYIARARLGLLLAWLGDWRAIEANTRLQPDPHARTHTILEFDQWRGDVSGLCEALSARPSISGDVLGALCAGMGMLQPELLTVGEREAVSHWLLEIFQRHPHAGTHFSAWFALDQWKIRHPDVVDQFVDGQEWISLLIRPAAAGERPIEIQFARLPVSERPDLFGRTTLGQATTGWCPGSDQAVWMAVTETSLELFELCLRETGNQDPVLAWYLNNSWRPEPAWAGPSRLPALRISRGAAVRFNRWLERKLMSSTGALPRLAGFPGTSGEPVRVSLVPAGMLHDVSAAGSTTEYAVGSAPRLLDRMLNLLETDCEEHWPRQKSAAPSGLGLFDLAAGARELSADLSGSPVGLLSIAVGGYCGAELSQLRSGKELPFSAACHQNETGFRVMVVAPRAGMQPQTQAKAPQ